VEGKRYIIYVQWPDPEQARWEAASRKTSTGAPKEKTLSVKKKRDEDAYTPVEKAWLKEHYGGEYKFL